MRAHVIEDGKVVNTIEVKSLDFMPNLIDADLGGKIGDLWDGARFTASNPIIPVPQSVTMRQARLALLQSSLLDNVDSAIAAIADDAQRRAAQIEWDYSSEVRRDKQLVALLAPALGLDDAALDQLFITAATL